MQIENTTFEKHYRIGGLAETRVSTAKLCGSWSRMIRALSGYGWAERGANALCVPESAARRNDSPDRAEHKKNQM